MYDYSGLTIVFLGRLLRKYIRTFESILTQKWKDEQVLDLGQDSLLYSFYKTKNPEKLGSISTILERYEGREGLLYANLMEKYEITTQQLLEEFPELKEAHIRFTELLETEKAQESVLGVSDEGGRERVMSNSSNARADVLTDLKSSVNILGNQIPTFEGLKEYNTDFFGKLPPMEGWKMGTGLRSSLLRPPTTTSTVWWATNVYQR